MTRASTKVFRAGPVRTCLSPLQASSAGMLRGVDGNSPKRCILSTSDQKMVGAGVDGGVSSLQVSSQLFRGFRIAVRIATQSDTMNFTP